MSMLAISMSLRSVVVTFVAPDGLITAYVTVSSTGTRLVASRPWLNFGFLPLLQ